MKIYVEIDGDLCTNTHGNYKKDKPQKENIKNINKLYDMGHNIVIWTARGSTSKKDWRVLTTRQLKNWGVQYNELLFNKPSYDLIIEDRCVHVDDLKEII